MFGFCGFARAFSSCSKWGLLLTAVSGLVTAVVSLVMEHRFQGTWASVVVAHRLTNFSSWVLELGFSSCGAWA